MPHDATRSTPPSPGLFSWARAGLTGRAIAAAVLLAAAPQNGWAAPAPTAAPAAATAAADHSALIRYTAIDKLAELRSLRSLPRSVLEVRLGEWRTEFERELARNDTLVSDAALLILQALLLGDTQAAMELSLRYKPGAALGAARSLKAVGSAPFPAALREALPPAEATRLHDMQGLRRPGLPEGISIRIHPYWWNEPGCVVTINGVPMLPKQSATARAGTSFYVQRVCSSTLPNNKLATGHTPLGRDALFVAFREAEPVIASFKPMDDDTPPLVQVMAGSAWGKLGQVPLSPGGTRSPTQALGLRLASNQGWSFHLIGASVETNNEDPEGAEEEAPQDSQDGDDTGDQAGKARPRAMARINIERRFLFELTDFGTGSFFAAPLLGAGIVGLHQDGKPLDHWDYVAPHLTGGAEVLLQARLESGRIFELGLRSSLLFATPPFRGFSGDLLVLVGITF